MFFYFSVMILDLGYRQPYNDMSLQIPVGARDEEREELLQRGDGGVGDSSNFAMAAEAGTNMSSGESVESQRGLGQRGLRQRGLPFGPEPKGPEEMAKGAWAKGAYTKGAWVKGA